MRHLAHILLNPLVFFWLVLLMGLFLYYRGAHALSYRFFTGAVIWLFVISISPLPIFLCQQRESRHAVLWKIPDSLPAVHILILGAGHSIAPSLPPNDQLSHAALSRLAEGIRLKHTRPDAKLIGSGNSSSDRLPQATVLMNAALALGISPSDTLQNVYPFNTETEAISYAQRFGTTQPLILVTSALHMPRALFWFRQQGLEAVPAPTDHYIKPDLEHSPYNWKPSAQKIAMTSALLHEWAGMLYANWKTSRSNKNEPIRVSELKDLDQ